MPNCFTLEKNGKRANFAEIDDAMRIEFNEPPSVDHYLYGWYDTVGLAIAVGQTEYAKLRETFEKSPDLLRIINWLEANGYKPDAWYQPR